MRQHSSRACELAWRGSADFLPPEKNLLLLWPWYIESACGATSTGPTPFATERFRPASLPMSLSAVASPPFKIAFGPNQARSIEPGLPVLAGDPQENLFRSAQASGQAGAIAFFQQADWLIGAASVPLATGLKAAAHQLYREILQATPGRHLARIWNYVPAINESRPSGLENYRSFCQGRSLAFEERHGEGFKSLLPAASAVGSKAAHLTVVFAACATPPRHIENPLQIPAYEYPGEYGPRAPSFARATVVPAANHATVFISGTAAIRGHETVAPHCIRQQLACTLENLREISAACGIKTTLDQGGCSTRHFKIYLRHASDQALVADTVGKNLLQPGDRISYLHADICRESLSVEIEATLLGVTGLR